MTDSKPRSRGDQFNGTLQFRVFKGYRERVAAAARREEMTLSEWLRAAIRTALRASEAEAGNRPDKGQETI